jgi:hypothetical protein
VALNAKYRGGGGVSYRVWRFKYRAIFEFHNQYGFIYRSILHNIYKNVKILIEVGKGRSVSGKIALKSAERSAPFIIICILSIAMSTGQMRALQLKNQNALEITINSAKIERVVFGTTASGHILYDKDSEKFSFLSHDGKILFTTKDR